MPVASRQGIVGDDYCPHFPVRRVLRPFSRNEVERVKPFCQMIRSVSDKAEVCLVQESIERQFQQLVAGANRDAIMAYCSHMSSISSRYRCQQLM